jgi:hypothetical protein
VDSDKKNSTSYMTTELRGLFFLSKSIAKSNGKIGHLASWKRAIFESTSTGKILAEKDFSGQTHGLYWKVYNERASRDLKQFMRKTNSALSYIRTRWKTGYYEKKTSRFLGDFYLCHSFFDSL